VCSILLAFAATLVPRDIEALRGQMRERAERERAAQRTSDPQEKVLQGGD
jgi:hypothetical protein